MKQEATYYDSSENIYAGKLYVKTLTYNAGASGLYWRFYLLWLAEQINSLLNSLPDGYTCEFVSILSCTNFSVKLVSTTGTSHALITTFFLRNNYGTTSISIGDSCYTIDASSANNCHYTGITYVVSSGNINIVNHDAELAIQPNSSKAANVFFKLNKQINEIPT